VHIYHILHIKLRTICKICLIAYFANCTFRSILFYIFNCEFCILFCIFCIFCIFYCIFCIFLLICCILLHNFLGCFLRSSTVVSVHMQYVVNRSFNVFSQLTGGKPGPRPCSSFAPSSRADHRDGPSDREGHSTLGLAIQPFTRSA
jgi:hypothetical protein